MNNELLSVILGWDCALAESDIEPIVRSVAGSKWPLIEIVICRKDVRAFPVEAIPTYPVRPGVHIVSLTSSGGANFEASVSAAEGRFVHFMQRGWRVAPDAYTDLAEELLGGECGVAVGGVLWSEPGPARALTPDPYGSVNRDQSLHPLPSLLIDRSKVSALPEFEGALELDAAYHFYLGLRAVAKFDLSQKSSLLFTCDGFDRAVHPCHSPQVLAANMRSFTTDPDDENES